MALVPMLLCGALPGHAEEVLYRARLSTVPIDHAPSIDTVAYGTASASLAGSRLSVTGSFEGLQRPATAVRLHVGSVMGVRGPAVFVLEVTKATDGTFEGFAELGAVELQALKEGRIYVQIHSEEAPDGKLWGWLLPSGTSNASE
jgi:hypothetical protein